MNKLIIAALLAHRSASRRSPAASRSSPPLRHNRLPRSPRRRQPAARRGRRDRSRCHAGRDRGIGADCADGNGQRDRRCAGSCANSRASTCSRRCSCRRRDEHAGHVRALQGRHELPEGRARAAHQRRARQGRSRRSVLVRLRPLLPARSRDRVVAQQGQAAVRRVRARAGDVERHAAHARARCSTPPKRSASSTTLHTTIFREIHVDNDPLNTRRQDHGVLQEARRQPGGIPEGVRIVRGGVEAAARGLPQPPLPDQLRADGDRQRQVHHRRRRWPAASRSCSSSSTSSPRMSTAAEQPAAQRPHGMLNIFIQQPQGLARTTPGSPPKIPDEAIWIDLLEPTPEEEKLVEATLGIDVPTREEMKEIETSNRLYEDNGALYMTTHGRGAARHRPAGGHGGDVHPHRLAPGDEPLSRHQAVPAVHRVRREASGRVHHPAGAARRPDGSVHRAHRRRARARRRRSRQPLGQHLRAARQRHARQPRPAPHDRAHRLQRRAQLEVAREPGEPRAGC